MRAIPRSFISRPRACFPARIPHGASRLGRASRLDDERGPGRSFLGLHVDANEQRHALLVVPAVDPGWRLGIRSVDRATVVGDSQLGDVLGEDRALRIAELRHFERVGIGNDALLHEQRTLAAAHDGKAKIVDAAFGDARREDRRVPDLVALPAEQDRQVGDLPHPLWILRGDLRAQIRLRRAQVRDLLHLRFAAVPAARGHRERAIEECSDSREQHERDRELDQREAARVRRRPSHRVSLAPTRSVARAKLRVPPEGAANVTSAVIR
jgi:hypothetical protein